MTTEAEVIAGLRKELRDARRIISATHKNPVVHTNCEVHNCPICDGGLFQCADCGAAEIETETRVCSVALQAPQEAGLVRDLQLLLENYTAYAGDAVPASIIERSRELHARLSALSQPVATPAPSQDAAVEDVTEFMRRLGPRWFLEQNWFPSSATRPAEAQAVADGWKLVPVEPTEAMCVAGCREDDILGELVDWRGPDTTTREVVANLYRTMLAASPATGGA